MPDPRVHESVAERIDIVLDRVPEPLRRTRRTLIYLAAAAPLLWLVLATARQDRTIYESRPVTAAHRLFENDCGTCHTEIAQPLVRLATFDHDARSVRDEACRHCHAETSEDHNAAMIVGDAQRCVDCHREHLDRDRLVRVTDAHCVGCHAELRTKEGSLASFAAQIASFSTHAEFAVVDQSGRQPGPNHLVRTLASRVELRWTDKATIRFNHKVHLDSDGVPVPPTHPDFGDGKTFKQLNCVDCHQADDEGRYMREINYERHCSACHTLDFSTRLLGSDTTLGPSGPLPHVELRLIRGMLRERLMAYAEQHPEEISQAKAPQPSRLPKRPANTSPAAKDRWQWVEQQLGKLDDRIAAGSSGERIIGVAQNCAECHEVLQAEKKTVGGLARWTVTPPNIPARWMPHSRFSHARHASMRCVECHKTPGASDTTTLSSSETADVLMPSIETCRKCHGAPGGRRRERARSDCVECHLYHSHSRPYAGRAIGELLGN